MVARPRRVPAWRDADAERRQPTARAVHQSRRRDAGSTLPRGFATAGSRPVLAAPKPMAEVPERLEAALGAAGAARIPDRRATVPGLPDSAICPRQQAARWLLPVTRQSRVNKSRYARSPDRGCAAQLG